MSGPGTWFTVPASVGWWRGVRAWCGGQNVMTESGEPGFGTCFLAMIGNLWAIITTRNGSPEIMTNGEIEYADSKWTGFNPSDRSTDRGLAVITTLRDWMRDGWPGQPSLRPRALCTLSRDQIPMGIYLFAAVCAWVLLPFNAGEIEWTDEALRLGLAGTGPHAVLIVESSPGVYWLVSYEMAIEVSEAWLARYGRGYFGVLLDQWHHPDGIPAAELLRMANQIGLTEA